MPECGKIGKQLSDQWENTFHSRWMQIDSGGAPGANAAAGGGA
jgi:hypothetical protein